jgi:uncharacterized protein
MMQWTAFLLGLVGSLHCAGMCGPLMLALPAGPGGCRRRLIVGRLIYNAGRIITYALIGSVFGLLGQSFALAGLQRWVSIGAGVLVLGGLFFSSRFTFRGPIQQGVNVLKRHFGGLLRRPGATAQLGLGVLNGLLPCGLVYTAAAGAVATASAWSGLGYMVLFGLGTVPMMLALGLAGHRLQPALRFKLQRLIPVGLTLVGALLILRGLELGIPYLSPVLDPAGGGCGRCH